MALWSVAFLGSTPIGGPLIGWITALSGARVGLGVGRSPASSPPASGCWRSAGSRRIAGALQGGAAADELTRALALLATRDRADSPAAR